MTSIPAAEPPAVLPAALPTLAVVVLARDAATTIARTLRSIAGQHALRPGTTSRAEVVVVVNGTTDATALVAEQTWHDLQHAGVASVPLRVRIVDEAGRCNAWNVAVHEATSAADVLVFCDAGIELGEPHTLGLLVEELARRPHATAAAPVACTSPSSARSRLVRWVTRRGVSGVHASDALAAGCYAIRGDFARSMELPRSVAVDDGFLHTMVATSQFTEAPDPTRVVRVPDASFVVDGAATLRDLLDHERRLAIGATYNTYAFRDLRARCSSALAAGPVLIARNRVRPQWIDELVLAEKHRGRRWFVPRTYVTRRFSRVREWSLWPHRLVLSAMLLTVGVVTDVVMSVWANGYFRTFESAPIW